MQRPENSSAPPSPRPAIIWLPEVEDYVANRLCKESPEKERILKELLETELQACFPDAQKVTVYRRFTSFTDQPCDKIILGVEVRYERRTRTHIIKLGTKAEVAVDYDNWYRCGGPHIASRIFVSLDKKDVPDPGRAAVIYENAYSLYDRREGKGVESLEEVAAWAVYDDKPDPRSVVRVLRQIYGDLSRWFYRNARMDPEAAREFYRARLQVPPGGGVPASSALGKWDADPARRDLRRDALWLLDPKPEKKDAPAYLDPYDYACWALLQEAFLPETLVGKSQGDLHGRNILVGVQRGEAEYPAVFDYGEMRPSNVLVWDFVKLEMELKSRLLHRLWDNPKAWEALDLGPRNKGESATCAIRVAQIRFAAHFERLLAELTSHLYDLAPPAAYTIPPEHRCHACDELSRLLLILLAIRQEAAVCLVEGQGRGRRDSWREEYYFALLVYGLNTAKFPYDGYQQVIALTAAGIAAAQVEQARGTIQKRVAKADLAFPPCLEQTPHPYPSYRVPGAVAYGVWKTGDRQGIKQAIALLKTVLPRYGYATPLLQHYALLLAEDGQTVEARKVLDQVRDLCRFFQDSETLSRIGRTYKDAGDAALQQAPDAVDTIHGSPAAPLYATSYQLYQTAFDINPEDYYPGINAATLALLCDKGDRAKELAQRVVEICSRRNLAEASRDEQIWIAFTLGEAAVLLRRDDAVGHYQQALALLARDEAQMAQSAWNQLCRLYWRLRGATLFQPIIAQFQAQPFKLKEGPLGNCGLGKEGPGKG
jgi:hypothetical protein